MTYREICLEEAKRVVCQSREREYGSPEDSFQQIRVLWEAYLGVRLAPHDVAMMMALLKIARIKGGCFKEDSFVDAAGYVACGYEIARRESEGEFAVTDEDKRESEENFAVANENETASRNAKEAGERGENEKRGESVTQVENDTPPDTDTQTDTDPQTETNTQTQFQFGVKDGKTKTAEEREKEIESCVACGLRESQRAIVFRDAQRGVGVAIT